MSTDLVKDTRSRIQARIKELRPAVDELQELEQILAALGGGERKPARHRSRGAGNSGARTRGRKPERASEFMKLIEKRPGITVNEAAKEMGIQPNYLYRVGRDLLNDNRVEKDGSGYKAVGSKSEKAEKTEQEASVAA